MFSNLYPPVATGSATQSAELARELVRRGCQVVVITARIDASPEFEQVEGVAIYRLPAWHLPKLPIALNFPWLNVTFTPGNQKRIKEILERHRPDVLHLHNHMFDLAFSAVLAAKRFHKPLVITMHTVIKHPTPFFDWILQPLDRWFLKKQVIDQADLLICPDLTIQGYVDDAFGERTTRILPYGIAPMLPPDPESVISIRKEYAVESGPIILSLGHLHEIRNRKELIEIMPRLREQFPGLLLLIVGDIGTKSAGELAHRLGVSEAIRFTGAVPYSRIPSFLALADLEAHWFQQDNPQNKTLGIAALEAMSAGKVVIGTADEGVYGKGVLCAGQNVILIDPGDLQHLVKIISDLLKDDVRRRAIGEAAAQTILRHFSWDSVCTQTINVYQSVIAKR